MLFRIEIKIFRILCIPSNCHFEGAVIGYQYPLCFLLILGNILRIHLELHVILFCCSLLNVSL